MARRYRSRGWRPDQVRPPPRRHPEGASTTGPLPIGEVDAAVRSDPGEPSTALAHQPPRMGLDAVVVAGELAEVGLGGLARWPVLVVGHGVVAVEGAAQGGGERKDVGRLAELQLLVDGR